MSGYIAFIKKEFTENMKNYRFLILFAVFLIFGIMSAFLAKFTPEILSALAADMEMTSEPVALDAWKQFYKNISGVGFSAFIIMFGSCLSNEYSKGTLVLMVTKGLSRKAVILAKYTVAAALMTISYWIGYASTYGYTALLWNDNHLSKCCFRGSFTLDSRLSIFEYFNDWVRDIQTNFYKHTLYRRHCRHNILTRNDRTDCEIQSIHFNFKKYRFDFRRSCSGRIYDTCCYFHFLIHFGGVDCHSPFQ